MKKLGVNIDHVATLRQARGTSYPDPLRAAEMAIAGGADGITVHLREDRRHIQDADVRALVASIGMPLNLEMAVVDSITEIACRLRPATATLVPERREELTTEGGLKIRNNDALPGVIERLKGAGITVSLFVDPDIDEIRASHDLGVDMVELHTGSYCGESTIEGRERELARLKESAALAVSLSLNVAAGHGLHYDNTRRLVELVPEIDEYNIGHAIVARAIFVGIERAVKDMKSLLEAS